MRLLAYVIAVLMWFYWLTFRMYDTKPDDFWAMLHGHQFWVEQQEDDYQSSYPKQEFREFREEDLPAEFKIPPKEDYFPDRG